jgi:RimJ/RimL family protein N-acetyltransferase
MIIYEQHPEFLEWASNRIGQPIYGRTLTQVVDGQIEAVAVIGNQSYEDVELSFASRSPKWQSRKFIREVFRYIFYQLDVARVTSLILEDNAKARDLVERIGYTKEGIAREAYKGKDLYIYGMLKRECPWL